MKATNFNYDHYNKTLEKTATTTTTLMVKMSANARAQNSFSRVKVITIYRPQKSVTQHKSK